MDGSATPFRPVRPSLLEEREKVFIALMRTREIRSKGRCHQRDHFDVSGVKAATLERVVTSRSMDFSSVDRLLFIAHATYHHIRMSYETVSRDEHVHFS